MAEQFYIRRGQKTVGPTSIEKIRANISTEKIVPTNLIATSPDGPWQAISDFPPLPKEVPPLVATETSVPPRRKLKILSIIAGGFVVYILYSMIVPAINSARRAAEEREIDARRTAASEQASSYAIQKDRQEPASLQNPQVVSGNTFEDFDYAFSISRPSKDWQFLNEKNATQLQPDSVMAMTDAKNQGFFSVIAEELEGSLDSYVNLIATNYGEDAALRKELIKIDGLPAVKMTFKQTINGIECSYANYLLKKDRFAFQLFGGATSNKFANVDRDIEAIAASFTLAKDRQPQARVRDSIEDDYGFDWIIEDDVYSNGSFGFRIDPDDGMRLMGRDELSQINNAADAGLVSSNPATYHLYLAEKTQDSLVGQLFTDWEQEMGIDTHDGQETAVEFAGQAARQRSYYDVEIEGNLFDFIWTYFSRDGVLYRYVSWWPSADRKAALPVLEKSSTQLSWLNADQQRAIEQKLSVLDANNAVGADFSLRNGVFRDFAGGYTYTLPSGLWKANVGDAAVAENPDHRLGIIKADEGIYLSIIPEKDLDTSAEEYHRLLLANFEAAADTPIKDIKSGTLDIKLSAFELQQGQLPFSYRLATVVKDNRFVQLVAWALKENKSQLDARLEELVGGLRIPEAPAEAEKRQATAITDNRLGYQVAIEPGWRAQLSPHPQFAAVGSVMSAGHADGAVSVAAFCGPTTDFTDDMMIDTLLRNAPVKLDPTTRKNSKSTLGGLPARCVAFKGLVNGQRADAVLWITRRGNTTYVLIAFGEEGLPLKNNNQRFSLID